MDNKSPMIEQAMDRNVFTINEYKALAVHDMAIRLAIDVLSSRTVEGVGIMELADDIYYWLVRDWHKLPKDEIAKGE